MLFNNKKNNHQNGFIAIITSLLLSAIVYFLAFSFSSSSVLGRYDMVILNNKRESRYLAEDCLEYARLQLAQNINYAGNETITNTNGSCSVGVIQTVGSQKIIPASASLGNGKTVLKLTISLINLEKIKLEELQS